MSALREGGKDSPFSSRRILAFYFAILFPILAFAAIWVSPDKWYAYIPAGLCIGTVVVLLFFTTWSDVRSIIEAARKEK